MCVCVGVAGNTSHECTENIELLIYAISCCCMQIREKHGNCLKMNKKKNVKNNIVCKTIYFVNKTKIIDLNGTEINVNQIVSEPFNIS